MGEFESKQFFLTPYRHPFLSWIRRSTGIFLASLALLCLVVGIDVCLFFLASASLVWGKILLHSTLSVAFSLCICLGFRTLKAGSTFEPLKIMRRPYKSR